MGAHRVGLLAAKKAQVLQLLQSVSLKVLHELLRHGPGDAALLFCICQCFVHIVLQVSAVSLVVSTVLTGFHSLGLDQHSLASLFVLGVVQG